MRGHPRKYDWPSLEIGDSIFELVHPKRLRASAWKFERKSGRKFRVWKDGLGSSAIRVK